MFYTVMLFHAQNLLSDLEECLYYFKLNVNMNNFIFDKQY